MELSLALSVLPCCIDSRRSRLALRSRDRASGRHRQPIVRDTHATSRGRRINREWWTHSFEEDYSECNAECSVPCLRPQSGYESSSWTEASDRTVDAAPAWWAGMHERRANSYRTERDPRLLVGVSRTFRDAGADRGIPGIGFEPRWTISAGGSSMDAEACARNVYFVVCWPARRRAGGGLCEGATSHRIALRRSFL